MKKNNLQNRRKPRKTNHQARSTEQGLTLVEVLLVAVIFLVVMGIVFTTLKLNETFRDLVFIRIQLYRQNRRAYESITEELQKSQGARVWITPDNPSGSTPPTPDGLRFQIHLANKTYYENSDGSLWGGRYHNTPYPDGYIRYWVNSTTNYLMREVLNSTLNAVAGTQEIKATDIIDLQLWMNDPPLATNTSITLTTRARKMTMPIRHPIEDNLTSIVDLLNP